VLTKYHNTQKINIHTKTPPNSGKKKKKKTTLSESQSGVSRRDKERVFQEGSSGSQSADVADI